MSPDVKELSKLHTTFGDQYALQLDIRARQTRKGEQKAEEFVRLSFRRYLDWKTEGTSTGKLKNEKIETGNPKEDQHLIGKQIRDV